MSFKQKVLAHYIWEEEIYHIISHDVWVYLPLVLKYSLILVWLYWLFWLVDSTFNIEYLWWIFGGVGLFVYWYFVISFLDIYLDSVVLTDWWVIIFNWDWFLKQNSESVQRESIESIFDESSSLPDLILNKWDIMIKRQWEIYRFDSTPDPRKQADVISKLKDKILAWKYPWEEEPEEDLDKFDVLVETLWEVILDYVKKKN